MSTLRADRARTRSTLTVRVPERSSLDLAAARLESAGYAAAIDGADLVTTDPWGNRVRLTTD